MRTSYSSRPTLACLRSKGEHKGRYGNMKAGTRDGRMGMGTGLLAYGVRYAAP